jgi:hypothetical protein
MVEFTLSFVSDGNVFWKSSASWAAALHFCFSPRRDEQVQPLNTT